MTGLDRLRGYARRMDELSVWPGGAKLLGIADQIEHEHAEDCFRMGERAAEDAEAAAWVREHGGLDHVREEWRSRVPYDKHERARQRLLDHIAECETALGRRNVRIEELGSRVGDLTTENAELRKLGERVKRPAVLAADGQPLEVGQTVWVAENGNRFHVVWLCDDGLVQGTLNGDLMKYLKPEQLTHQRPVLDADGVPIRVGDEVYGTVEGGPFIVTEVSDKGSVFVDAFPDTGMHGSMFTHTKPEPPDSWEKIEEDIGKLFSDYWGCKLLTCDKCPAAVDGKKPYRRFGVDNCIIARNVDLVRRCKALAERESGE